MDYIATAVGIFGVIMLAVCYQQKTRKGILICNIIARSLFILQYILLFAFEGMALDLVGIVGSVLAQQKEKPFIKKHTLAVVLGVNGMIVAVGILMYQNLFSLLPLFAVLFQINALWCSKETHVRLLSLAGAPCWFAYNLYARAYGSVVGDLLSFVSLIIALLRYDVKKAREKANN